MADVPEGVEPEAVTRWLSERVEAVAPPLRFDVISGGRSNLTFEVSDSEGRRWALRRPPLHSVLRSAHDMNREQTVISALEPTDVPVPVVVGYEPDTSLIGAEFYVMEFVDGLVVRDADDAIALLDERARAKTGESLIEALVRLHAVDPDAVGLDEFAKKEDYIARQLHRWHGQLAKGSERDLPVLEDVHDRLRERIPPQGSATIVHGDYRLDNAMLAPNGEVLAILDWELCTLGDPLADVGLLAVYWSDPGDETIPLLSAPTAVEGFPRRDELLDRYAEMSGRALDEIGYYVAFAYWKLAVILEGVYTRFAKGAYGSVEDAGVQEFADVVVRLGEQAAAAAASVGR